MKVGNVCQPLGRDLSYTIGTRYSLKLKKNNHRNKNCSIDI